MLELILDFGAIVIADLVLSGDNALIIGMAAASLAPDLRKKAILYGYGDCGVVANSVCRSRHQVTGCTGLVVCWWIAAGMGLLEAVC